MKARDYDKPGALKRLAVESYRAQAGALGQEAEHLHTIPWRKLLCYLHTVICSIGATLPAFSQGVLDQVHDSSTSASLVTKTFDATHVHAQTITFGIAGRLTRIEPRLSADTPGIGTIPLPLLVRLYPVTPAGVPEDSGPAWAEASISLSGSGISTTPGWFSWDLRGFNISVQQGQTLAIAWGGPGPNLGGAGYWHGSTGDPYPGGQNFSKTLPPVILPGQIIPWNLEPGGSDLDFKTFVEPLVPPSIVTSPTSQTVTNGDPVSFSVVAAGSPTLNYQWTKDGTNIPGATAASINISNVQMSDAGDYLASVSNAAGSTNSAVARLTVVPVAVAPPVILRQPQSARILVGGSATLAVLAGGNGLNYEWRKNGGVIAGAGLNELRLTNAQPADAGDYTVRAGNSGGSVTSRIASVTVVVVKSTATSQLPAIYVPGTPFTVTVDVRPDTGVFAYAVEEKPPTGWTISNINSGGTLDVINAKIKWGPFFDDQTRTLSYQVLPPASAQGNVVFTGTASFDGLGIPIGGQRQSAEGVTIKVRLTNGEMWIDFTGSALYQASQLNGPWMLVSGAQSPYRVLPVQARLFFRSSR